MSSRDDASHQIGDKQHGHRDQQQRRHGDEPRQQLFEQNRPRPQPREKYQLQRVAFLLGRQRPADNRRHKHAQPAQLHFINRVQESSPTAENAEGRKPSGHISRHEEQRRHRKQQDRKRHAHAVRLPPLRQLGQIFGQQRQTEMGQAKAHGVSVCSAKECAASGERGRRAERGGRRDDIFGCHWRGPWLASVFGELLEPGRLTSLPVQLSLWMPWQRQASRGGTREPWLARTRRSYGSSDSFPKCPQPPAVGVCSTAVPARVGPPDAARLPHRYGGR